MEGRTCSLDEESEMSVKSENAAEIGVEGVGSAANIC